MVLLNTAIPQANLRALVRIISKTVLSGHEISKHYPDLPDNRSIENIYELAVQAQQSVLILSARTSHSLHRTNRSTSEQAYKASSAFW